MTMIRTLAAVLTTLIASCSTTHQQGYPFEKSTDYYSPQLVQGLIGATQVTDAELDLGGGNTVGNDKTETFPMIGGVFMLPLRGNNKTQLGGELGFTTSFQGDVVYVQTGGNGAVVIRDNDLFLLDVFVGLYINRFFGDFRVYGGIGPLLQFGSADVDVTVDGAPVRANEDAFGIGFYGRTGLEFKLGQGMYAGLGVRWVDSNLDLSGGLGDLDYQAIQYAFTVTTGF